MPSLTTTAETRARRLARVAPAVLLAALTLVLPRPLLAAPAEEAARALHQLADAEWEWRLAQFPERATVLGDHRYDDRLTDRSPAAVAARRSHHRERLSAVRAIDRNQLAGEDRLTFDVIEFDAELDVRGDELLQSVPGGGALPLSADDTPFAVNPMSGPQLSLPQLVRATRFQTEADYRNYLARLHRLPTSLKEQQAILEAGRRAGWMPPRAALTRLPGQFAPLLDADLSRHALYAPFAKFPDEIAPAVRAEFAADGARVVTTEVIPALRSLRDYLATVYVPAGTSTLGATSLPHGADYYAWSLQRYNTTRMTAAEIHALGEREVARIDAEIAAVVREAGFAGSVAEFRQFLRTDPRFLFTGAEEELAYCRDLAKRIDPQLPGLFVELPRLPYGVRAMSPEEGSNAPHYIAGALDGSRAGYFEANTNNLAAWPRWTMEALVLHEAVPGHHLQIARAQELGAIPKLRRASGNSGYSEGWALYAEGLGRSLGLYADPYTRYGRLALEAHRASRLVVDTGLHSLGWTREQAIAHLIEHGQVERAFAEAEVDRYLVWPGQATAYKVGEQRILALRERARTALGPRFDLRRFHNALLDHGPLPLTVLDRSIDEWLEAERQRAAP